MGETWLRKLFETKKERKLLIWPPCRCGSVVVPLFSQGDKTFCQIPEFGLLAVVVPLWSQKTQLLQDTRIWSPYRCASVVVPTSKNFCRILEIGLLAVVLLAVVLLSSVSAFLG